MGTPSQPASGSGPGLRVRLFNLKFSTMAQEYKQDYKRTYMTMDNINVAPDDEIWVAEMNLDSLTWEPQAITAKQAEDKNKRFYWSTYEQCMDYCADLNDEE